MGLFRKTKSKKSVSVVRILSAVLVLGVLVLIVAESAKYLYVAEVPKSVSSKIDPSVGKLASVLGAAKTSMESVGNIFTKDDTSGTTSRSDDNVTKTSKEVVSRIAVLSDSHNNLENLKSALEKAKNLKVEEAVFLGDYTDWGEEVNLSKSKEIMDQAGIKYVSLPGDHDLGETSDESNFIKVFGNKTYGVWEQDGFEFMYFDNSKNHTVIDSGNIEWFKNNINSIDFLFLSQPLVTSGMSRVMGIIDDVKDEAVYAQNKELLDLIRSSKVRAIISGDLHEFSHYVDPVKKNLQHFTVGALVSQGLDTKNIYPPRFVVLNIFDDNSYSVDDTPID